MKTTKERRRHAGAATTRSRTLRPNDPHQSGEANSKTAPAHAENDVARQQAVVATLSQRAVHETDLDCLLDETLQHIAAALQASVVEAAIVHGKRFVVTRRFGWSDGPPPKSHIPPAHAALYAEAAEGGEPITRALGNGEFAAATCVMIRDQLLVFAAYVHEQPFRVEEVYPLQACATMYAAAAARRLAEEQFLDREARLHLLLEQIPAVLWTIDFDLYITSSQGAGLVRFGRTSDQLVGMHLGSAVPETKEPMEAARAALRGESTQYKLSMNGQDWQTWVEPLRDRDGRIVGAVGVSVDVTERHRTEDALLASREELRRLSARMNRVQEEERKRIAREIHDDLGQRLTAMRIEIELLRAELRPTTASAEQRLEATLELIDETIHTVRRVAKELRPAVLDDFGFQAAVEMELAAFERRSGMLCAVNIDAPALEKPGEHATAVFRIVQEALTNIARHSGATRVDVSVFQNDGVICAEVRDNGRGIADLEVGGSDSLGLTGMRERAWAIGGDVIIGRKADGGTRVTARIPLSYDR